MATPEPTNTPTSAPSPTATLDPKVRPLDPTLGSVWDRPKDEMGMVYVPAGPFSMGSDEGYSDMLPIHDVTLDGFWIDRMEVNNDQFAEFVSGTGYRTTAEETGRGVIITESGAFEDTRGADWQHPQEPESDLRSLGNHPVVLVSWYDARAYCEWAGGILPTEAQWEYAARGPEGLEYPWGENFDGEKANYCDISCGFDWKDEAYDDGYARTAPVGIYPEGASWTGTLDMAGNVWEWVNDWYDSKYYADVAAENPMGPVSGQLKVLRGGGWFQPSISDPQMDLRSAYRLESFPEYRNDHLGFRCVLPGR
jgi:formylglycine-generating enzyme required for sulfatase activity